MGGEAAAAVTNRGALTVCMILATLMQALDTTIANVALPYMQGSVSASQDQIAWVLTSYIVAAAIMTPPTGFLASRFGLKRLFLVAIGGFTVASMLCGMAQSLNQIVLFRILQGAFGASLVPLSQTVLFASYPRERQGFAMALFGIGVMIGPVLGPVLGGWLTENYSWRYVFYINLPIGILDLIGIMIFLPKTSHDAGSKLDWFGFGTLSVGIGALQLVLDRGEQLDWFSSGEIIIEAIVAVSALYLCLVHTFTAENPFVRPSLFRDRNFSAGIMFISIVGLTYYASMALQPPYLQGLMDYPVVTAGLVMGPRGIGTMASMLIVGRLVGRVDTRILLAIGLGLTAWSFNAMTEWTPDVSQASIIGVTMVQGAGLGFLFVPLSAATLATLPLSERTEGAGFFSLSRNIGSSVGISVVNALLVQNTQANHAAIVPHVTAVNRAFENPTHRARVESLDCGRAGRARCSDNPPGGDHRLYRRLQASDDRDACGNSAAHGVQTVAARRCGHAGCGRLAARPVSMPRWRDLHAGMTSQSNLTSVYNRGQQSIKKAAYAGPPLLFRRANFAGEDLFRRAASRRFPGLVGFRLLLRLEVFTSLLIDDLHRQSDLAAIVKAKKFYFDLVAFLDHIAGLLHPALRQLADMHQPVLGAEEVHERAEVHHLDDGAFVDVAELRLGRDRLDPVDRRLDELAVGGRDLHRTVVLDVDLGAGLLDDLTDNLAAGADDFADLVGRDLERLDARRMLPEFRAGGVQRLRHFSEDMQAAILGLSQRDPHDLLGDAGDLDIHLQRGDAAIGAGHLEVHVAEMILVTEDVGEHGKALILFDEAHRDARGRPLERHAGIHQRE